MLIRKLIKKRVKELSSLFLCCLCLHSFISCLLILHSIASGSIELLQDKTALCEWQRPHFFGEEALCEDNATRLFDMKCVEEATLLVLQRNAFRRKRKALWLDPVRKHLKIVSNIMKSHVLKHVSFLSGKHTECVWFLFLNFFNFWCFSFLFVRDNMYFIKQCDSTKHIHIYMYTYNRHATRRFGGIGWFNDVHDSRSRRHHCEGR